MALYENGILISGANTLPQMTLAEYQALPVSDRPTYWERTDLNYGNIPASDVTYGSGSVEDALDGITAHTLGSAVDLAGYSSSNKYVCPSDGYVTVFVTGSGTAIANLGSNLISCTDNGNIAIPVFVRKGQEVYPTLSGGGKCSFYGFQ